MMTGLCESACNPGWYGGFCNQTCIHEGCYTCNQTTGECLDCKTGFYDDDCSLSCSEVCEPAADGSISCNKLSGACNEGRCVPGYWGEACFDECNENCLKDSSNVSVCAYLGGNCSFGCVPTYYGGHCDMNCSRTCVNALCGREGTCSFGCVENRFGPMCMSTCIDTCNDNTCDVVIGTCSECLKDANEQSALCRTAGIFNIISINFVSFLQ